MTTSKSIYEQVMGRPLPPDFAAMSTAQLVKRALIHADMIAAVLADRLLAAEAENWKLLEYGHKLEHALGLDEKGGPEAISVGEPEQQP